MKTAGTPGRLVCFVSYGHEDTAFVDFLERMLALYRDKIELLRDRGGVDRRGALDTELRAMIARCDVFMPVVSAAYALSEWCQREHTWLDELRPHAAFVPLRLAADPVVFPNRLGVDFAAWALRGDRIVRETLIPVLLGGRVGATAETLDGQAVDALGLARDFQVLGAAVNRADLRAPADEAFVQIGVRLMQLRGMPARGRAMIAAALAGQQVQRGRWEQLRQWASLALAQLEEDAVADDARSDDELAFLGERCTELALAERRLGDHDGAARHYQEAADRYRAISDALLQRVRYAQVCREQGTLAIARLRLDEARRCYAESRALLAGLPSERMHVAQAWIKEAQVELIASRDADVDRCMATAAEIIEAPGSPVEATPGVHELSARVAAHYWKTRAFVALARGHRAELARAADEHARVIAGYPWQNERGHQRALRIAVAWMRVLPRPVTRQLARAFIVAEAGLLAGVRRRRWPGPRGHRDP